MNSGFAWKLQFNKFCFYLRFNKCFNMLNISDISEEVCSSTKNLILAKNKQFANCFSSLLAYTILKSIANV